MKNRVLIIAFLAVVVLSVGIAGIVYFERQNGSQAYDPQKGGDFKVYYNEFGKMPLLEYNYAFTPPVTLYRALRLALESGNWNSTSLESVKVSVWLAYWHFWRNSSGDGYESLRDVTNPVSDYSPAIGKDSTYRYAWTIQVEESKPQPIGTPSMYVYLVDASTAEVGSGDQTMDLSGFAWGK